jgi:uncharacterized phage protein gp47/JayE
MSDEIIYGLTETGFNIKRHPEIIADTEADLKHYFSNDIDLRSDSVFGQINGVYSKPAIDIWEILETLYQENHPSEASGVHLDYICEYNAITRLPAISSQVIIGLLGDIGTIIPQNSQIEDENGNIYYAKSNYTLQFDNQLLVYININNIADNTLYTIQFDSTTYSYMSSGTATESEIINGLIADIELDLLKTINVININDAAIKCENINYSSFTTVVSTDLNIWVPAVFLSLEKKSIYSVINSIINIVNPISGLNEVNNFEEGTLGRLVESDTELRLRRKQSLQKVGGGNLNAIVSRIINDVPNVVSVKGYENREPIIVDSLPPHSINIFIEGGEDADIANILWLSKGGGIQTYGNTFYDITDSNGNLQRMFWSRPTPFYTWVKVSYTKYSEEIFPSDGETTMKNTVLTYGNTFTSGLDIIPQRFISDIFKNVIGIETLLIGIFASLNSGDTPSYVTSKIAVAKDRICKFDLSRITVVEV